MKENNELNDPIYRCEMIEQLMIKMKLDHMIDMIWKEPKKENMRWRIEKLPEICIFQVSVVHECLHEKRTKDTDNFCHGIWS
jgi:hypothetical protein